MSSFKRDNPMRQLDFVAGGLSVSIWQDNDCIRICGVSDDDNFRFEDTFDDFATLADLTDVITRMLNDRNHYVALKKQVELLASHASNNDIPF